MGYLRAAVIMCICRGGEGLDGYEEMCGCGLSATVD